MNEFPDSEYAPRAVYALGYINGVVLGDTARAREWYDVLMARYPDSAQAQLAYGFYKGAAPPPPMSEWVQKQPSAQSATSGSAGATRSPQPPVGRPADIDSTRIRRPAAADSTAVKPANEPAPADTATAPADTTAAPADSTGGGG